MPAVRMTLKNGTGQACAACKHQRRRCTPDCVLAPFFPADQHELFQSVHRLFGVKHVQNLLKELPPHEKPIAIRSIKFHAAMREKYPVYGCLVEIQHLTYQIQLAEEELQLVLHQLAYYRQQRHQQQEEVDMSPGDDYVSSKVQLGMAPPGNGNGGMLNAVPHDIVPYSKNENAGYNSTNSDYDKENNEDVDSLFMQETCSNNANSAMMMNMMIQPNPVPQEEMMHSFSDTNIDDDAQLSYIGSKEMYESSVESPLKDFKLSTEQMAENELKSAAACFSLTSVN
ncbi:hypothetical protein OROMI_003198 [Orobanche minor]